MFFLHPRYTFILLFLWSLTLRIIANSSQKVSSEKTGFLLLTSWTFFLVIFYFFTRLQKQKIQWNFKSTFLAIFIVLGSTPILENDQYRYFWEGRILSQGKNPYSLSPNSLELKEINFPEKKNIAFSHLTSPYSPLTLIFFSFFSFFSYKISLFLFQLINIIFLAWFSKYLNLMKPFHALVIFTLLIKEFAQSAHMELLSIIPFFYSLYFMEKKEELKSAFFFLIATLFKITPLLLTFWFLGRSYQENKLKHAHLWFLTLTLSLALNYFWGPLNPHSQNGLMAYMNQWVWHPGALGIFLIFFDYPFAKILCDIFFSSTLLFLSVSFIQRRWTSTWASLALFSCANFFRPVFNPWYAPWFILPAGIMGNLGGLWYAMTAHFAYERYATQNLSIYWLSLILTHFGFILIGFSFYKKFKKVKK